MPDPGSGHHPRGSGYTSPEVTRGLKGPEPSDGVRSGPRPDLVVGLRRLPASTARPGLEGAGDDQAGASHLADRGGLASCRERAVPVGDQADAEAGRQRSLELQLRWGC
jgi:hypothetical protein